MFISAFKKHRIALLLITLTVLFATHQTLNFYFWHDDFSIFHDIRINQCNLKWPYGSYCTIFYFLYSLLGYSPIGYFALGVILAILCAITFYFLLLQFFPHFIGILASFLFSVYYFGAGTFLESYDSIFTFASLTLFFASLIWVKKATTNRHYLESLIIFGLSVLFFQARSSTYFLPFLTLFWLYSGKNIKKKIIFTVATVFTYWLTFIALPTNFAILIPAGGAGSILESFHIFKEGKEFLETLGAFVVPDILLTKFTNPTRILLISGIIGSAAFLFSFRNKNKLWKVKIFAVILIVSLYVPFGLRSDWSFSSTHRYIFFLVPGVLVAWSTFHTYRWWKWVTCALIVILFIFSNNYFNSYDEISRRRQKFYSDLHIVLPEISTNSILYFYAPPVVKNNFLDFLRVGALPSDASIASEYGINYKDITLILDNELLADEIKKDSFSPQSLFTFYYDGANLINTTTESRNLLTNKSSIKSLALNKKVKTQLIQGDKMWTGNNESVNFQFEELQPLVPFNLSFTLQGNTLASLPIPYTQDCINCDYSSDLLDRSFVFLTQSRHLKQNVLLRASHSGDGTKVENLNDGYPQTYWLPNRSKWFENDFPILDFSFLGSTEVAGIVFYAGSTLREPTKFEIIADGNITEYTIKQDEKGFVKVLFNQAISKKLSIKILETQGGDIPIIQRLEFIPKGFNDIDLNIAEAVRIYPAAKIETNQDALHLQAYLASGVPACLKWHNSEGEKGSVDFILYLDGKDHTYNIPITTIGGKASPLFEISCLTYPVDLELLNAQVNFHN